MNKFEIYIYDHMDEYDFLDCQINKGWLRGGIALKIDKCFYEVNFFTKETLKKIDMPYPNIIILERIAVSKIKKTVNLLIGENYFEQLKSYKSFESIIFYPTKSSYKGKLLDTIITDFHLK